MRAFPVRRRQRVGEHRARHAGRVGDQAVAGDDVRPEHAALVVGRVEVVAGLHHHDTLVPQRVDRAAHDGRVAQVRGRADDDLRADPARVQPRGGQIVGAVQRLLTGADRQQQAPGADARAERLVVRLRGGDALLVVGVVVGRVGGRRVVLVVVEVPAGDVVGEAVAVVVPAVGERDDQVLRIDHAVAVGVVHPGVAGVVGRRHRAVAVLVVGRRAVRPGQLAGVEEDLARQVGDVAGVPVDARLDVGDDGRRRAGRVVAPRLVDRHARRALRILRQGCAPRDEGVQVVLLAAGCRLGEAGAQRGALRGRVAGVVGRPCRKAARRHGARRADQGQDDGEGDGPETPHAAHLTR